MVSKALVLGQAAEEGSEMQREIDKTKVLLPSLSLSVLPLLLLLCSLAACLQLHLSLGEAEGKPAFYKKHLTMSDTEVLHTTMFFFFLSHSISHF